jgi:hypothetical protein
MDEASDIADGAAEELEAATELARKAWRDVTAERFVSRFQAPIAEALHGYARAVRDLASALLEAEACA